MIKPVNFSANYGQKASFGASKPSFGDHGGDYIDGGHYTGVGGHITGFVSDSRNDHTTKMSNDSDQYIKRSELPEIKQEIKDEIKQELKEEKQQKEVEPIIRRRNLWQLF